MKKSLRNMSLVILLYTFLQIPTVRATAPDIMLSEIQITGGTGHTSDDFVELYNSRTTSVDISNYRLLYKNSSPASSAQSLREIPNNTCLAPNSYYLWANSSGAFADSADTKTGVSLAANHSLALFLPEKNGGTLLDSVSWGSSARPFDEAAFVFATNPEANQSLVRNLTTGDWLANFSSAPTPTKSTSTNCSKPTPDPTPLPTTDSSIRINEIFPNPSAKGDTGEFIELYNFGSKTVDISGWILRDATKTGKYIFPSGTLLPADTYLSLTDQSFKLSLNNSNETLSLFDNTDALIDSVHYVSTKEDVSLNYSTSGWRGGIPTPGAPNQPNNLPETTERVPKVGYRDVAVNFNARGKDSDHDTLKYTWDFGDGHKSYKEKTSHVFEKNGTYTILLKTNDGKDDTEESFSLKIESYPHKKVRITSLLPNPSGNDTENEYLILINQEKKTINLKGYSIATGWKKLSNHPIRENFFIEPKKETKLTHDFSLFTLPNQKGRIELRAPDGKVLQKIQYKLEKSVAEDVAYTKKKGIPWEWKSAPKQDLAIGTSTDQEIDQAGIDAQVLGASVVVPEETAQPTQESASDEIILNKHGPMSLDPQRPDPKDILAYSTRVTVPDNITLAPLPNEKSGSGIESLDSSTDSFFSKINSALNTLLNTGE